jgi:hypothetical protein
VKKLISIENGKRTETIYSDLSDEEINHRIRIYEQRYGRQFHDFYSDFDSDKSDIGEIGDFLDWKSLVEEGEARAKKVAYERT